MPYVTPEEYVKRYGSTETIRITDESKTGQIDQGKLSEAIDDQDQIIDSYLASRYVLPITGTFPILEGISAALTREALHRNKPTPAITDQADRARGQLKDLAAGRATLPVAVGQPAPGTQPEALAVRANDARPRVFTADALDGFTNFGGSSGRTVFNGPGSW